MGQGLAVCMLGGALAGAAVGGLLGWMGADTNKQDGAQGGAAAGIIGGLVYLSQNEPEPGAVRREQEKIQAKFRDWSSAVRYAEDTLGVSSSQISSSTVKRMKASKKPGNDFLFCTNILVADQYTR